MKQVYITELAESDLAKIWEFIARDNIEAADSHLNRLKQECMKCAINPESGRLRPELAEGIRARRFGKFLIFYFATNQGIEVARVLHGARDLPRIF